MIIIFVFFFVYLWKGVNVFLSVGLDNIVVLLVFFIGIVVVVLFFKVNFLFCFVKVRLICEICVLYLFGFVIIMLFIIFFFISLCIWVVKIVFSFG